MKQEAFSGLPNNPKGLVRAFIGSEVTLLFKTGGTDDVKIEAIVDNILVATKCDEYLFIDIPCICGIKARCEDVIGKLLSSARSMDNDRKDN